MAAPTMPNPLSVGLSVGGSLLEGLMTYFAMKDQNREIAKNRTSQENMFNLNRADENQRFGQQLGEGQRQFDVTTDLTQQQMGQNYELSNKKIALEEKGMNLSIAESKRARAEALKQKKLDDSIALLGHMSSFFNTPQARQQFASVWSGR